MTSQWQVTPAVERAKKLDDDFGPAIAIEVGHLELKMGGNTVGFLGGVHVIGQGIDHSGLNVERGPDASRAMAGTARAEKARRARSNFMGLVSVAGRPMRPIDGKEGPATGQVAHPKGRNSVEEGISRCAAYGKGQLASVDCR